MPTTSFELFAEKEHPEGFTYKVSIDSKINGLNRLVIAMTSINNKAGNAHQGVDLTSDECLILGNHLLSIATTQKSTSLKKQSKTK